VARRYRRGAAAAALRALTIGVVRRPEAGQTRVFPLGWSPVLGTRLREIRFGSRDSLHLIQGQLPGSAQTEDTVGNSRRAAVRLKSPVGSSR
jgi:hypothetical protein